MANKITTIRIIFMGTSEFANKILNSMIAANLNIVAVFTKPDKKSGREHEIKKSGIKITAKANNIPVFQPEKLDEESVAEIKNQKPDLIIVAAYGRIIPKDIIDIPRLKVINVHPSLLPKFRGPSPIQNAILNGETETGTTLMLINEGMDTGDILKQVKTEIGPNENGQMLSDKLATLSADLLLEALPLWVEGKIAPVKQMDSEATLCQLIEKNDGRIIWTDEAESIHNRFRALSLWPGIFTFWENEGAVKRMKLNKINFLKENLDKAKHHLGEVFQFEEKIGVQTTSGIVILEEIQLEGKENMKIADFINGNRNFLGSILK